MTCSDVQAVLSISLVPGGVDARSLLGVEEHVAGCEGCRAEKIERLRCLVALELDRCEAPDLAPALSARLNEEAPRVRGWGRRLAVAAVLAAAVGLMWAIRTGDEGQAPPAAGVRPPTPHRRTAAREERLLLANGHELLIDRRLAWVREDASKTQEDWGDRIVDDRSDSLELRTGVAVPQLVPRPQADGDDEQVFPLDIDDEG